ncbi:ubiquinol-cytochrome c reductase iron-sulfur subunit [Solitalea lacus]|uniref:QcrA and Rieske domain-containing protein n=1 Tax=Solitalea lacus TaxID=2911172 RepID=UPI001EDC1E8B|nr:Rieske 2Fe-2S domain-containing protein [Solitalea lacus]UKJ08786.1 Rieske 2Fe-2S domain-containing protein [Solitalea lacus]
MKRNEFLAKLGIGAALVCTGSLMEACGGGGDDPAPSSGGGNTSAVNFNLNVDADLPNVGSSKTRQGIIVVRTATALAASSFVALEAVCPHEHGTIFYDQTNNRLECSLHSSRYSLSGSVINGPVGASGSTRALHLYNITLTENTLTITS